MTMKQNLNDVTFKISNVSLDHSGNYSCFYSTESHNLTAVAGTGQDDVEILVIAHFIPAVLSVVGPASVHEGNRIEFKCSFSRTLHTISNCQFIYCSLKKNKTFLQLQVFDVSRMEAYFVIEGAVGRDSGHYSCLLLPSKCYQTKWKELQGINDVFLAVKEESISWGAMSCGLIVFIVLFGLFLRWIYHKTSFKASFTPWIVSSDREEQNTEKLEPMNDEPHEDGEDDSFSMENEEQ
ncbi:PREDICTED: uncharacterized protein LOC107095252 [Cyprinodon variegatus]|uniref:uncharacterized protein LOC107095252 n=1 Tax=Cyprinodon variegatus TaxID=28743 RepID=UPI0007424E14|nr:PREDICTED: uncharacterized protein LOC107095252 [Cyprinodon variegatus]